LLQSEYFTPGDRRDVYQAMLAVAGRGEPLGELTVAWELNRIGPARTATAGDRLSDYLGALATATVQPGAALLLGQELMADVFRVELEALSADVSAREAAAEAMRPRDLPPHGPTRMVQPDSPGLMEPPPSPGLGPDGPSMRI
jgi:replicative DNA helicase